MNEWINVKNSFPPTPYKDSELSYRVFVLTKHHVIGTAYYCYSKEKWVDYETFTYAKEQEITHWAPIPQLPKDER